MVYSSIKFPIDLISPPTIARISEDQVEICLPWRLVIDKSDIKEIFISDTQCEIIGFEDPKPIIRMPVDRFDCSAAQLATVFENKEYSIRLEMAA